MRYRKRPIEVDAVQFTGHNVGEVLKFTGDAASPAFSPSLASPHIKVDTLEGVIEAHKGDWIIRGIEGEFYPCRDSVFRATYEPVSLLAEGPTA